MIKHGVFGVACIVVRTYIYDDIGAAIPDEILGEWVGIPACSWIEIRGIICSNKWDTRIAVFATTKNAQKRLWQ